MYKHYTPGFGNALIKAYHEGIACDLVAVEIYLKLIALPNVTRMNSSQHTYNTTGRVNREPTC